MSYTTTLCMLSTLWKLQKFRAKHAVDSSLKPPTPEQELWAVKHFAELEFKTPVMAAMKDFYELAHSGTVAGKELLQMRMMARHPKRRRAMGVACIAIDVALGLLDTLSRYNTTSFTKMADAFRRHQNAQTYRWTDEAILRVLFRAGMMELHWPEAERLWPTCLYGMLTAALAFTGGRLLTRLERRALFVAFNQNARLGCLFARGIITRACYGAGLIYWVDSTQPDAPPVPFTHASLEGFMADQGPYATDLASRLVQTYMGETQGVEAHALYIPGLHCRRYCLGVVRGWLLDTADAGKPRPSRPPPSPTPRSQRHPPPRACRAGKRLLSGIGLAIEIDSELVLDRSDLASRAIEQAWAAEAAMGGCPEGMLEVVGDCEGEGGLEGEDEGEEGQEGDDADGVEGEMDVDMDGGQVVDEDEMMPDGDA
jgi:hypothetical protein